MSARLQKSIQPLNQCSWQIVGTEEMFLCSSFRYALALRFAYNADIVMYNAALC